MDLKPVYYIVTLNEKLYSNRYLCVFRIFESISSQIETRRARQEFNSKVCKVSVGIREKKIFALSVSFHSGKKVKEKE